MAIEPKTIADKDRLSEVLQTLIREDPTLQTRTDQETGQVILSGMGELHLEVTKQRMLREFRLDVNVGTPRVAYKETLREAVEVEGRFVKQTGGRGQYGHVKMRFEPNPEKTQIEFESRIRGEAIPREFINPIAAGVRDTATSGGVGRYPMVCVLAILLDGSSHAVDSSEIAFHAAGSIAFQKAIEEAGTHLLEPIMKVEIITPESFLGEVHADLNRRRADISGMDHHTTTVAISATAPLAEMFGYTTTLRSLTQGRATHTLEPLEYRQVPSSLAKKLLART